MVHPLHRALALGAILVLGGLAQGQSERPWARLFGSRTAEKAPVKAAPFDPRRLAEIQVEIAWLADPLTFPYYLEARTAGGSLEVRGYVPNRAVREQALNLARLYAALPVVDAVKEHPSLLVKAAPMAPAPLQASVTSALREALPRQAGQLQVKVAPAGKVVIAGVVPTHEERLTVSHALRRLHGCTSVQNLTRVPTEPTTATAKRPEPSAPPTPPSNPTARTDQPPAQGPVLPPQTEPTRGTAEEVPAAPVPATPALAAQLKKRIEEICTGVKGVRVEVVAPTEFRVEVTARTEEQVGTFAGQILMLPELQNYRADLQFKVMP